MDMDVAHDRAEKFLGFFDLNDFADEPLVGLDPKGARQVKQLFQDLCAEGTTNFCQHIR